MGSEPRRDLPSALERRIAEICELAEPARSEALARLRQEHPEHAAELDRRCDPASTRLLTDNHAGNSAAERLRRLAARGAAAMPRYELRGEVARGGMGVILRAFDQDLGRTLAMKVVHGPAGPAAPSQPHVVEPHVVERFIEEAQITGQLDHPGVVPVHELGVDADGRAFFTMRLVRGTTAQEVFAFARAGQQGWTQTRALEVLLKVCDTLAYAHEKGVVHRDLKPSNIMVGKFGEVYVMDWGLAKVLGQPDVRDLRIRPQDASHISRVRTDRSKEHESDSDTALRTMDGAIVGTPCYMPPEQAHGHVEQVGVKSDVYAVGAMLYTLLTGSQPYLRQGSPTSPYMVLELVRATAPAPIRELDRSAPPELVAICERAMARSPEARYESMGALADDLRAYVENRVVRAYRTGAWAELVAWVRRNRGAAAGIAVAVAAVFAGGAGALFYAQAAGVAEADSRTAQKAAESETRRAEAERERAENARGDAERALSALLAEQREKERVEEMRRLDRLRDDARRRFENETQVRTARARGVAAAARGRAFERLELVERELEAELDPTRAPVAGAGASDSDSLGRMVAAWPDGALWQRLVRGHRLMAGGDAAAIQEFTQALPKAADNDQLRVLQLAVRRGLAAAHLQAGDIAAAIAQYDLVDADLRLLDGPIAPTDPAYQAGFDRRMRNQREAACAVLSTGDPIQAIRTVLGSPRQGMPIGASLVPGWFGEPLGAFGHCDFRWASRVDGPGAALPELRAASLRLQGNPAAAIAAAAPNSKSLAFHTTESIETARSWLALHQPRRALAVLDENLRRHPPAESLLPQLRQLHEVRSLCLALLGQPEPALAAAEAALRTTAATDVATRGRLAERRADLLMRLGRPAAALEAWLGGAPREPDRRRAIVALRSRLRLAEVAAAAGRVEPVEDVLPELASDAAPMERVEFLVHEVRVHLVAGRTAAALAAARALAPWLPDVTDPWLLTRAHVRVAEAEVVAGETRAATVALDQAARALQRWLLGYARFRGAPLDDVKIDSLRGLGETAIRLLADLASGLPPDELPSAWRILETFRAPVELALGTRPARSTALGGNAVTYERARADWLAACLRAEQGMSTTWPSDLELTRLEEGMRAWVPTYCGAVLPRVPALADARRAVAEGTALVVLAAGAERGLAFVLTATDAALVPLAGPPTPDGATLASALAAAGERLIAPILDSRPIRSGSCRRLLFAPVGGFCALPIEWCLVPKRDASNAAEREPLLSQFEVACVASGSAWFDQRLARLHPRTAPRGQPTALVVDSRQDASTHSWLTEILSTMGGGQPPRVLPAAATALASARAVALSLPIEPVAPRGSFAALRSDAPAAAGALTQQDLRDAANAAELAVVHAAGPAIDVVAEADALAGAARALASAGVDAVVTVGAATGTGPRRELALAIAKARLQQADVVTAMTVAARELLRRGVLPSDCAGIRLWSVGR